MAIRIVEVARVVPPPSDNCELYRQRLLSLTVVNDLIILGRLGF